MDTNHLPVDSLPAGLSKPALRALHHAGITRIEQITALTEGEIKQLHGVGPHAIKKLREALGVKGLSFKNK